MDKFITIGVTGGIGSGKSYVCRIIEAMGYPVFYSDFEAKKLLNTDSELIKEVRNLFGEMAYQDNQLNKVFLAEQIFKNPELRKELNGLVHPRVRAAFTKFSKDTKSPICFNEAAILFETGSYKNFSKNILVTAPESLKISRLKKRDNSTENQIKLRMDSQWTDEQKSELADFIINNDENEPLLIQITEIINSVK